MEFNVLLSQGKLIIYPFSEHMKMIPRSKYKGTAGFMGARLLVPWRQAIPAKQKNQLKVKSKKFIIQIDAL